MMIFRFLTRKAVLCIVLCFMSGAGIADVSVVVHPDSNIDVLTKKQIKKLFLGRLRMLPYTGKEALVVDQVADSLSHKVMYSKLVKMTPTNLKRYRAAYLFSGKGRLPVKADGDDQVKKLVAGSLSAIGYIDAEALDDSVKSVYLLSSE